MNDLIKYKQYKRAVTISKDIKKCLIVLNSCMANLDEYKKFTYVNDAIYQLREAKINLKIHLQKLKSIVESKDE